LRLIDFCITQLKAQGPSRTCNESKEEVQGAHPSGRSVGVTPIAADSSCTSLGLREREREREGSAGMASSRFCASPIADALQVGVALRREAGGGWEDGARYCLSLLPDIACHAEDGSEGGPEERHGLLARRAGNLKGKDTLLVHCPAAPSTLPYRYRANLEHTHQSRPKSGLGLSHFQCEILGAPVKFKWYRYAH